MTRKTDTQIATELIASILEGTGTTVDRFGDEPTSGYVVGVEGIKDPSEFNDIVKWIASFGDTAYYFGAWRDDETGSVYYDAVEVYDDLYDAMDAANARGELAVWDLVASNEIRTEH